MKATPAQSEADAFVDPTSPLRRRQEVLNEERRRRCLVSRVLAWKASSLPGEKP